MFKILGIVVIVLFMSIPQSILAAGNNGSAEVSTEKDITKVRVKKFTNPKTRGVIKYKNKGGNDGICLQPLSFSSGRSSKSVKLRAGTTQLVNGEFGYNSTVSLDQVVVAELLRGAFFQLCNEKQIGNIDNTRYNAATQRLMLAVTLFTIQDILSDVSDNTAEHILDLLGKQYNEVSIYCIHENKKYSPGSTIKSLNGKKTYECKKNKDGDYVFQRIEGE